MKFLYFGNFNSKIHISIKKYRCKQTLIATANFSKIVICSKFPSNNMIKKFKIKFKIKKIKKSDFKNIFKF